MKIYDRNFQGAHIISKMGQNKDIEMSIGYILLRNTEKGMYMHIQVYIEPKKREESKWNRKKYSKI